MNDGPSGPVVELAAATRNYMAAVRRFRAWDGHLEALRRMLRHYPSGPAALRLIQVVPDQYTTELFPELVRTLCDGPIPHKCTVRDILRSMDKSEVGRLVEAADLDALLADVGDADELALFTDMLIEFRLDAAVARLAAHAAQHDDAEMQDLARFLARVPGDERHWGRSRAERVALLRPPDDHR